MPVAGGRVGAWIIMKYPRSTLLSPARFSCRSPLGRPAKSGRPEHDAGGGCDPGGVRSCPGRPESALPFTVPVDFPVWVGPLYHWLVCIGRPSASAPGGTVTRAPAPSRGTAGSDPPAGQVAERRRVRSGGAEASGRLRALRGRPGLQAPKAGRIRHQVHPSNSPSPDSPSPDTGSGAKRARDGRNGVRIQ